MTPSEAKAREIAKSVIFDWEPETYGPEDFEALGMDITRKVSAALDEALLTTINPAINKDEAALTSSKSSQQLLETKDEPSPRVIEHHTFQVPIDESIIKQTSIDATLAIQDIIQSSGLDWGRIQQHLFNEIQYLNSKKLVPIDGWAAKQNLIQRMPSPLNIEALFDKAQEAMLTMPPATGISALYVKGWRDCEEWLLSVTKGDV